MCRAASRPSGPTCRRYNASYRCVPDDFSLSGALEERIDRVKACVFWVYAVSDNKDSSLLADIQFSINKGTATKEQLELKRSLDKAVTVVKVALSATTKPRNRQKQNIYIRGIGGIGQVGLMEGNLALAGVTLETLQDDFGHQ